MPVSKKRKKGSTSKDRAQRGGNRTSPQLPSADDDYRDRILSMPPEWLPTVGLSETYLVMSPLRNINQCHVAIEVVMRALHLFGLPAEAVALEIEVENSRGSIVHHGRAQPQFANGQVLGHVGLIADDHFLDITASTSSTSPPRNTRKSTRMEEYASSARPSVGKVPES